MASAAAGADFEVEGEEDLICSICQELLSNEVILPCGHSFCNACILQRCGDSREAPCPECGAVFQESEVKPNQYPALGNLIQEVERSQHYEKGGAEAGKRRKGKGKCPRGPQKGAQEDSQVGSEEDSVAPACKLLDVEDEGRCPICKDYLSTPISVDCGHIFCWKCITEHCSMWVGLDPLKCPVCTLTFKEESFRKVWQMSSLVDKIKILKEGNLCMKHLDKPCLFCAVEEEMLCKCCDRNLQRSHLALLPKPQAEQYKEYLEKAQALKESFQETRQDLMDWKKAEEKRSKECLDLLEAEEKKLRGIFEEMQKLLVDKESLFSQLEDLKSSIKNKDEENSTRFSDEITYLESLIAEMRTLCEVPALEFLEDIRTHMGRYQKRPQCPLLELSPDADEALRSFSEGSSPLKKAIQMFRGSLETLKNQESLVRPLWKVTVTLDKDTAQPHLVVSEDLKSVHWQAEPQMLGNTPERFDKKMCVLGCEKFTSGKQWWEVEVMKEVRVKEREQTVRRAIWAVGVAKESVKRKSKFEMSPTQGVWAIGKTSERSTNYLCAFTSRQHTYLTLSKELKKIRVCLDYEKGHVEFCDADTHDLLFAFPSASFSGGPIRPFFFVWRGKLCLS